MDQILNQNHPQCSKSKFTTEHFICRELRAEKSPIFSQTFYRRSKPKCSTKHFHDPLRVETTTNSNKSIWALLKKKGEKIPTTIYARDEWQHVWWGYASVWPDRGNVDIETVEGGHIQTSGVAIDPSSSCTSSRRCSKESSLRK